LHEELGEIGAKGLVLLERALGALLREGEHAQPEWQRADHHLYQAFE
jgi:hypothetical protein